MSQAELLSSSSSSPSSKNKLIEKEREIDIDEKEVDIDEKEVDIDGILSYFKCTICHNILNDSITLFCQHTFCRNCLDVVFDHLCGH